MAALGRGSRRGCQSARAIITPASESFRPDDCQGPHWRSRRSSTRTRWRRISAIRAGRRGLPLRPERPGLGRARVPRAATFPARSTRTSNATCPGRRPGRTAAIRCPIPDVAGATLRRLRHRPTASGGRLRPGHRHVREPPVVAAALAGTRRRGGARRRIREVAGRRPADVGGRRNARTARRSSGRLAPDMVVDVGRRRAIAGRRTGAPGRRARARTIPRRHRADRPGRRAHSGRRQRLLSCRISTSTGRFDRREDLRDRLSAAIGGASPDADRLLLRLGRDGLPQPARARARRASRREAVAGLVERVVERSVATGGTVARRAQEKGPAT